MKSLDGDSASEADRPEQARKMDRGHAAGRDLAVQRVSTQTAAVIRAGLFRLFRHLARSVPSKAEA